MRLAEAADPLRVVAVLVRQEHRIDGIDRFSDCFEHESDPLAGKAGINQDFAVAGAEQSAIAAAAGT